MEINVTRQILDACSNVINLRRNVNTIGKGGYLVEWTSDRAEAVGLRIGQAMLDDNYHKSTGLIVCSANVTTAVDQTEYSLRVDHTWKKDPLKNCPFAELILDAFGNYFRAIEDPRNNPYGEDIETLAELQV